MITLMYAKFKGTDSLGYEKGNEYLLIVTGLSIRRIGGTGLCKYGSVAAFFENWVPSGSEVVSAKHHLFDYITKMLQSEKVVNFPPSMFASIGDSVETRKYKKGDRLIYKKHGLVTFLEYGMLGLLKVEYGSSKGYVHAEDTCLATREHIKTDFKNLNIEPSHEKRFQVTTVIESVRNQELFDRANGVKAKPIIANESERVEKLMELLKQPELKMVFSEKQISDAQEVANRYKSLFAE